MKTVVFDLDGTLADTAEDLLAAANACFVGLGHPAPLDGQDALTAFQGGRAMLRLGFQRLGAASGAETEALVDRQYPRLLQAYAANIDTHTRLYPGVVAALQLLREQGLRTAICTNKPEGLAETLTHRLNIRHLFDSLIGADTLPTRKPDPAPYHAAVARAGGSSARSILIGDTLTDVNTARAAGVKVVLVSFGPEGQAVRALQPDALLDHYRDLPTLAARLLS